MSLSRHTHSSLLNLQIKFLSHQLGIYFTSVSRKANTFLLLPLRKHQMRGPEIDCGGTEPDTSLGDGHHVKESVRWCWWSGTNSQSKQSLCDDQEDMTTCVREELQERPHQTPDAGDKTWRHLENNVKYFIAAPGIPVESYKRYLLCGRAVARCTDSLLSDRQMIDTYRHSRPQQTQTIISTFTPAENILTSLESKHTSSHHK